MWWVSNRPWFDLFTSQAVLDEAHAGNPEAARRRLGILASIPLLDATPQCSALAATLMRMDAVPQSEPEDALHIAIAAVHRMNYLLTWNCAHLANAQRRRRIDMVIGTLGHIAPVICTPDALPEE